MTTATEVSAMNKAQIIAELEKMAVARLFGGQPWLADPETCSAVHRKLIQMGLVERVRVEPETWQNTPLGKELDVVLFEVFMGVWYEWEVPMILEKHHLIDEAEADALYASTEADAESVLIGYVKRAYFDYRKAHQTASVEIAGAPQSQLSSPPTLRADPSKICLGQRGVVPRRI